jgi:hypothetical protein
MNIKAWASMGTYELVAISGGRWELKAKDSMFLGNKEMIKDGSCVCEELVPLWI